MIVVRWTERTSRDGTIIDREHMCRFLHSVIDQHGKSFAVLIHGDRFIHVPLEQVKLEVDTKLRKDLGGR